MELAFLLSGWGIFLVLAILVEMLIIGVSIYNERGTPATVSILVFLGLLYAFGFWNIGSAVSWVRSHQVETVAGFLGFLAFNVLWSFVEWDFYGKDRVEEIEEAKLAWLSNRGIRGQTVIAGDLKAEWIAYVNGTGRNSDRAIGKSGKTLQSLYEKPLFRNEKARLGRYAFYGWAYFLDFLFSRMVQRIYNWALGLFRGIYDWRMDRTYSRVSGDLTPEGPRNFTVTEEDDEVLRATR